MSSSFLMKSLISKSLPSLCQSILTTYPSLISLIRKSLLLTQSQFASLLSISPLHLSRLELGKSQPSLSLSLTILLQTIDLNDLFEIVSSLMNSPDSQLGEEITLLFNIMKEKEEGVYE